MYTCPSYVISDRGAPGSVEYMVVQVLTQCAQRYRIVQAPETDRAALWLFLGVEGSTGVVGAEGEVEQEEGVPLAMGVSRSS